MRRVGGLRLCVRRIRILERLLPALFYEVVGPLVSSAKRGAEGFPPAPRSLLRWYSPGYAVAMVRVSRRISATVSLAM